MINKDSSSESFATVSVQSDTPSSAAYVQKIPQDTTNTMH